MLDGIAVRSLKRFADERGFFSEIFRRDWKETFRGDDIFQANLSITYPNVVRAWHKHERGQIDYFVVVRGSLKICVYNDLSRELDEIICAGEVPQIVRIPGKYWHGFRAIGCEPATLVYFMNTLYDYDNPDELRRPWNDPEIVPEKINGSKEDPRCNKSWDWFYPPFR